MTNDNNTNLREYRLRNVFINFSNKIRNLKENYLFLIKCIINNPNFSEKDKTRKIAEYAATYSANKSILVDKYSNIMLNMN